MLIKNESYDNNENNGYQLDYTVVMLLCKTTTLSTGTVEYADYFSAEN